MATEVATKIRLGGTLSTIEYFTFGFERMVGVRWLVLMDDWLARGGIIYDRTASTQINICEAEQLDLFAFSP